MSATVAVRIKQPRASLGAFTLIELVVTIAIVGILAAIAYPAFVNHVIKGNRSAAQQFMLDIANAQSASDLTSNLSSYVVDNDKKDE